MILKTLQAISRQYFVINRQIILHFYITKKFLFFLVSSTRNTTLRERGCTFFAIIHYQHRYVSTTCSKNIFEMRVKLPWYFLHVQFKQCVSHTYIPGCHCHCSLQNVLFSPRKRVSLISFSRFGKLKGLQEIFCDEVLKNFLGFTGKHLSWKLLKLIISQKRTPS